MYPGFLFPEEGASKLVIPGLTPEKIIAGFPDRDDQLGQWFAIEVTTQNWRLWVTEDGDGSTSSKWEPANDGSRKSYRIYIGELLTSAQVAALPGDHRILLSNMEYNDDCDPIMRTRCGNFQPFKESDVIVAPQEAMS
jgi:hypothetical protein